MVKNSHLSCSIDRLVRQYEEIWSRSMKQYQSQCSTGILNIYWFIDLCSDASNQMSSCWLAQKFSRRRKTILILEWFSSVVFNACTLLSYMEICVKNTIYLRFIPLGWQGLKRQSIYKADIDKIFFVGIFIKRN